MPGPVNILLSFLHCITLTAKYPYQQLQSMSYTSILADYKMILCHENEM